MYSRGLRFRFSLVQLDGSLPYGCTRAYDGVRASQYIVYLYIYILYTLILYAFGVWSHKFNANRRECEYTLSECLPILSFNCIIIAMIRWGLFIGVYCLVYFHLLVFLCC